MFKRCHSYKFKISVENTIDKLLFTNLSCILGNPFLCVILIDDFFLKIRFLHLHGQRRPLQLVCNNPRDSMRVNFSLNVSAAPLFRHLPCSTEVIS